MDWFCVGSGLRAFRGLVWVDRWLPQSGRRCRVDGWVGEAGDLLRRWRLVCVGDRLVDPLAGRQKGEKKKPSAVLRGAELEGQGGKGESGAHHSNRQDVGTKGGSSMAAVASRGTALA